MFSVLAGRDPLAARSAGFNSDTFESLSFFVISATAARNFSVACVMQVNEGTCVASKGTFVSTLAQLYGRQLLNRPNPGVGGERSSMLILLEAMSHNLQ